MLFSAVFSGSRGPRTITQTGVRPLAADTAAADALTVPARSTSSRQADAASRLPAAAARRYVSARVVRPMATVSLPTNPLSITKRVVNDFTNWRYRDVGRRDDTRRTICS